MTWKTQPTTGHLRGIARTSDGTVLAQTQVLLFSQASGAIVRSMKTDGHGWFAFVDLPSNSYRVDAAGETLGTADVITGRLTTLGAGRTAHQRRHQLPTATPAPTPTPTPTPSPTPPPSGCTGSVGPGIAPPANAPSGVRGFHASWYGQSGYPTLCPGETSTAVVAYTNSGSFGWVSGRMGEVAYLGTWSPEPGQDKPSPLGGNGMQGSPATGWPHYNRIAVQPAAVRGPGSGRVVPVHDPGATDTRRLSPLPAAAHRGRAVDGGLRRLLGRDALRSDSAAALVGAQIIRELGAQSRRQHARETTGDHGELR